MRLIPLLGAAVILPGIVFCIVGCSEAAVSGGPVIHEKLHDGTYEGEASHGPNSAKVRITVKDRKIASVELLSHDAWKGHKADEVIPGRIVTDQSTSVDAVSGATNSSRVIMNAAENAIEKACAPQVTL